MEEKGAKKRKVRRAQSLEHFHDYLNPSGWVGPEGPLLEVYVVKDRGALRVLPESIGVFRLFLKA